MSSLLGVVGAEKSEETGEGQEVGCSVFVSRTKSGTLDPSFEMDGLVQARIWTLSSCSSNVAVLEDRCRKLSNSEVTMPGSMYMLSARLQDSFDLIDRFVSSYSAKGS